jgi:hypothetical protein
VNSNGTVGIKPESVDTHNFEVAVSAIFYKLGDVSCLYIGGNNTKCERQLDRSFV